MADKKHHKKQDRTQDKNLDNEAPLEKKLEDLYKLIDGMEVALMTTRRPDGYLVSRPMQTQQRTSGTDLWFMANLESHKLEELATDPHVNLAYYRDRTREWVSVSGTAIISRDKRLIHELYERDWRAWLGDEGGARDGGPDDPRIALILVEAHSVTYLKKDRPMPVVLFNIVKGMVTGEQPKTGDLRELTERELKQAPQIDQREPLR
jgi:general stress protein 26